MSCFFVIIDVDSAELPLFLDYNLTAALADVLGRLVQ